MSARNMFRDFFRQRRVNRHLAKHGANFQYHGLPVVIEGTVDLSVANALLRGKYEREEAELILEHLPRDLPVIELGGSMGVISRLIGSRLAPGVKHLIVEANADLLTTCTRNALGDGTRQGHTEVLHAALSYGAAVARFRIGSEPHANSLDTGTGDGRVVEVAAVSLAELRHRVGDPDRLTLVADIEGAEFDLFSHERDALRSVEVAVVELHPRDYARRGRTERDMLDLIADAGFTLAERRSDVVLLKRSVSPPE